MLVDEEPRRSRKLLWWLLYVVSWVGHSALALWLTLHLRINLIDINNFFEWGPWILIGVDKFGFLLLVLGWLIAVFALEIYLRRSETLGALWRRSGRVLLVLGTALGISLTLQWLLAA